MTVRELKVWLPEGGGAFRVEMAERALLLASPFAKTFICQKIRIMSTSDGG